ncbi:hypothetical protein EHQ13_16470 [Leptospira gomenensis]|uniref:hypothetical protein n=1 Tax=Leptospira gomenensis TaxID=2484974 RepID=UPI001082B67B|nr:hypothetical protein [Leptospira gomenensis]TGK42610.1 hypothetical protein EHQ07_14450 [Leptospira gomenensis]TGK55858.1 hypothetical protein EHQ13_16470 [Leptospira gomenensis]
MDNKFEELLSNPEMRKVLKLISDERSIYRRSLLVKTGLSSEKLTELIAKLKKSKYINSDQISPFEDFQSIFITADGLSVERELNRLKINK